MPIEEAAYVETAHRAHLTGSAIVPAMCNLHALTKSQDEIRRLFEVETDRAGNLPPLPGIFPTRPRPIVHVAEGRRTLSMYRWGMPSPAFALKGKKTPA